MRTFALGKIRCTDGDITLGVGGTFDGRSECVVRRAISSPLGT